MKRRRKDFAQSSSLAALQINCAVYDVMDAGHYEIPAHILRFFSGATFSIIVCQNIPTCNSNVKLQCPAHDVMHVGSYEISAHLLCFFSGAASFTIVFERHSRIQFQRKTTACSSWCDAPEVTKIPLTCFFFLSSYFVQYSISNSFLNAIPT